jgi:hypothetical protein
MAHALVLAAVLRQFQKTAIAMRSSFFPSMKQQTQPCLVQGIRSTPHILWRKGNIGGGQDLPYNCSNMRPHQNLSQKCQPTLWFTGCLVTHLVQKLRNPRTMVASVTRVTAMMNLHEGINASVIKAMMGTPTCLMGAKVCIFQCDYFALISNYLFTHGWTCNRCWWVHTARSTPMLWAMHKYNTIGSYDCICPSGTSGNPRVKDGCSPSKLKISGNKKKRIIQYHDLCCLY